MTALIHVAFIGTLIAVLAVRTSVEVINLWHMKRCIETGYPGVKSFDYEQRRFKKAVSAAAVRTLHRSLLIGITLGFVYLGPFDVLVDRLGTTGLIGWWTVVGLGFILMATVLKSIIRTVEHSITYPRIELAIPLRWRIENELSETLFDVLALGTSVIVLFSSVAIWPTLWPVVFLLYYVLLSLLVNLVSPLYQRWRWRDEVDEVPSYYYSDVLPEFEVECEVIEVGSTDKHMREASQLAGVGPWKTVFIRDNGSGWVSEFETTLAHEMGHAEHRHIEMSMLYEIVEVGLLVATVAYLSSSEWFYVAFQLPQGATGPALLLALIWVAGIENHLDPIDNALSHWMEFVADSYAHEWGSDVWADLFRDHCNGTVRNPYEHWLFTLYNRSHPSLAERIRRARND